MSTKPIVFLGSSDQIIEMKETCDLLGLKVAGIIDDDYYGNTTDLNGIPYIGGETTVDWTSLRLDHDFFIPVNPIPNIPRNVAKRRQMIDLVERLHLPCVNIIDPQSRVSPSAKLGKGIFVGYSAYVAYQADIADHCQVHYNAAVAHNVVMGKNTILQRAGVITSDVTTGENVYIGLCARVLLTGSTVGADACIVSGVLVFRDVEPGEMVNISGRKIYPVIADLPPEMQ